MEHSSFKFKIKGSVDDAGTFSGMGAVFGNVDQGGDKIMPGAFTRTLAAGKRFPLLYQHKSDTPIGSVECTETSSGLLVRGKLLLDLPAARDAYLLVKEGIISGLSIGFSTIEESFQDGIRLLTEIKLFELSICTFPMNELARVSDVKTLSDDAKAEHLAAISTHQKAIAHHSRGIASRMKSLCGQDDEPDDDPELVESESEEMGMIISELKALVESASELSD